MSFKSPFKDVKQVRRQRAVRTLPSLDLRRHLALPKICRSWRRVCSAFSESSRYSWTSLQASVLKEENRRNTLREGRVALKPFGLMPMHSGAYRAWYANCFDGVGNLPLTP
jgi:hypothetical protein